MDFDFEILELNDDSCNCTYCVQVSFIAFALLMIFYNIVNNCKTTQDVLDLQSENDTLKRLVLKSIDKIFVRMLKNGYDFDNNNSD